MPRPTSCAVPVALVTLLLVGCSAGGPAADTGAAETSEEAPALSAPELEGDGGADGAAGGAPRFEGRRDLRVSAARRTAVDEPCTANQIERLCGSSAVFEISPVGPARRVRLVSATTRPDRDGLTWRVRLTFDPDGAPLPTRSTRGDSLVLLDGRGAQVPLARDAVVSERVVLLTGFPKRAAWLLVEQLSGEA